MQALSQAASMYNKQLTKTANDGASDNITTVVRVQPMLAQLLEKQNNFNYKNTYVQRKFNGVRAMATMQNSKPLLYSRSRLEYPGFEAIKMELNTVFANANAYVNGNADVNGNAIGNGSLYLDGEIYAHGVPLQLISGAARRESRDDDPALYYYVYDCYIRDKPELKFSERREILQRLLSTSTSAGLTFIIAAETWHINSKDELDKLYKQFIADGYEGAMIRTDEPYVESKNQYHSKALLKLKPVLDHEFKIIDYTTGTKGKAANALMIICENENNARFPVTPAMELSERIALAKKMATIEPSASNDTPTTHFDACWKGRDLIVEFDEWSVDGLPLRARTRMQLRNDF